MFLPKVIFGDPCLITLVNLTFIGLFSLQSSKPSVFKNYLFHLSFFSQSLGDPSNLSLCTELNRSRGEDHYLLKHFEFALQSSSIKLMSSLKMTSSSFS